MSKNQGDKLSRATREIIEISNAEFTPEEVDLGGKLTQWISRGDISEALKGDDETVTRIVQICKEHRWTRGEDPAAVNRALEWIRVVRRISAH